MITIRQSCIPCYDFLRRLEKVSSITNTEIPPNFIQMEEKTACGIITKCKAIIDSLWFKNDVVSFQNIVSGGDQNYMWNKEKETEEIVRVYDKTKDDLFK